VDFGGPERVPFVRAQGVELEERRCDRVFPERAQTDLPFIGM